MKRWSSVVMIETDGDPAVVLAAVAEAYRVAIAAGAAYSGPTARLVFSKPLTEAEVP